MLTVLMPIPAYGFDPTEVAVPWKVLSDSDVQVTFATPQGTVGVADELMLSGNRLGIWKSTLRARKDAVEAYHLMSRDASFAAPAAYDAVQESAYDGLFLPGGHDKGVKEYLESEALQKLVAQFFSSGKPVAAICHGVVLASRSIDPTSGKSVIADYKTTALLRSQEMSAYNLTRLWLKDYYLTYPGLTVEDEVRAALSENGEFVRGPTPIFRDSMDHLKRGFVVTDRNYSSARWPGDAYNISLAMIRMLGGSIKT